MNSINCTVSFFEEDLMAPGLIGMNNLFNFGKDSHNLEQSDFKVSQKSITISEKFINIIPELFFNYLVEKNKKVGQDYDEV
ncbi:hypothetical protein PaeCFBP13512_22295, partial [Paenibacillus sp. CFBP13512]|uniref:hypothetical protein n=1 Tax=Paenibacillus sp. CFBP13512 TaxID=2184007 RepID=UPI0010C013A8